MRSLRIAFVLLLTGTFLLAGYLTLSSLGLLGSPALAEVKPVPAGDQEIAWIAPATSGEAWERLVTAVDKLEREWPQVYPDAPPLRAWFDKAFLPLTADVPEIALSLGEGDQGKLWIRWYKLSTDLSASRWISKLAQRAPAPLAVIGGDTSDRALTLAKALRAEHQVKPAFAPVFLITTATAYKYLEREMWPPPSLTDDELPKLMDVYRERSFRYSFTNNHMAEAVLRFLRHHPQVWLSVNADAPLLAACAGNGQPWSSLAILAAAGHGQPTFLYTLAWNDDRYSLDLEARFFKAFPGAFPCSRADPFSPNFYNAFIPYSSGDFFQANPQEREAVASFLGFFQKNPAFRDHRKLLALPTGSQRARRLLRALCRRAPREAGNLVVASGDAITFNNIYRDRDIAWNIQDMPVPLVFFSHRNPVDRAVGFGDPRNPAASTGTQDLLLHRDVAESLLQAAFPDGRLLADAEQLRQRLGQTKWCRQRVCHPGFAAVAGDALDLFDSEGNRRPGTGEHIIWLRPVMGGPEPEASISVWTPDRNGLAGAENGAAGSVSERSWRRSGAPLQVFYDRPLADHEPHAREP